ncbi:DUF3289 family protein [Vibrio ostreicida]|uniref:DUF3289 family protein n=1 Tax=Vibrio ostreicida TaxID=526588 RepID=UPI001FE344DE|nr:DUF3289 family protein [Vibrio ostreicida]
MMNSPLKGPNEKGKASYPYPPAKSMYWSAPTTSATHEEAVTLFEMQTEEQKKMMNNPLISPKTQKVEEKKQEQWLPVEGNFPLLVFETKKKMDDFDAPDMTFGDETREDIEKYGLMTPFEDNSVNLPFTDITVYGEDQFSLPPSEHFKRMRSLANDIALSRGFSTEGETKDIFSEMVDKFERNEGGYYSSPLLSKALQGHETTQRFHEALKKCLGDNVKDGSLPDDILSVSSQYMMSSEGERLPKFDPSPLGRDLSNGTVLSVHDIWSLRVYVERLEYKGNQVRGSFKYEIQDHFGLDSNDINHDLSDGIKKQYEQLEGFRSWYLLQHFEGYGFKPLITKMDFKL